MAKVTVKPEVVLSSLLSLSRRLADALQWAHQHKRSVKIDVGGARFGKAGRVPQPIPYILYCLTRSRTEQRDEMEILATVLAEKGKKGLRKKRMAKQ